MVILLLSACVTGKKDKSFAVEHARWQEERVERLKSKTGWLNLAGLYWLEEGENTIGSDSSNSIVFPEKAPAHIGKYILENGRIRFVPAPGEDVIHGGTPATQMEIATDRSGDASLLESGSLAWFIIERSPRYGIRLRDYEHPAIGEFHGIELAVAYPLTSLGVEHITLELKEEPVTTFHTRVLGFYAEPQYLVVIRSASYALFRVRPVK